MKGQVFLEAILFDNVVSRDHQSWWVPSTSSTPQSTYPGLPHSNTRVFPGRFRQEGCPICPSWWYNSYSVLVSTSSHFYLIFLQAFHCKFLPLLQNTAAYFLALAQIPSHHRNNYSSIPNITWHKYCYPPTLWIISFWG